MKNKGKIIIFALMTLLMSSFAFAAEEAAKGNSQQSILAIFTILFGVVAIETLCLVFIIWKTPALTFLKASMAKLPVMFIIGKDGLGKFTAFKPENGAAKVGKDGLYNLTEGSQVLELGSKIPMYFAFRDMAATLDPQYPAIIQEIREKGLAITNIEDIKRYQKMIRAGVASDFPIDVRSYKTYNFSDLENMFPNNLDPTFIDATVQCEVAKSLKILKAGPQIMMGVVTLLIVASVAVLIIQKAFKGAIDLNDCKVMVSAAKCTYNAAATVTGTGPVIP